MGWSPARPAAHWVDYPDITYGLVGASEFGHWDNTLDHLENRVFYLRNYGAIINNTSADNGAAIQAALDDARAVSGLVVADDGVYTVRTGVSATLTANTHVGIVGLGEGTVFEDRVTTGPWLSLTQSGNAARVTLANFGMSIGAAKPTKSMVSLTNLLTANLHVENVTVVGNDRACFAAFYLQDLWEGSFRDCRFHAIGGHSVYYTCPTQNGGNIGFRDIFHFFVNGGIYIDGSATNNNVKMDNVKFVRQPVSAAGPYQYYKQISSGLPAIGASTVTVDTSISSAYFADNQAVVLHSSAGTEVVHLSGYNSTTGVLTFYDTVTKNHSAATDLRVVTTSNWAVITSFLTPNLVIDDCHFEGTPCFFCEAPGLKVSNPQLSVQCTTAGGLTTSVGFFIAGGNTEGAVIEDVKYAAVTSDNVVAYGLSPSGQTNVPAVSINRIHTNPINQADNTSTRWKVLAGDGTFNSFGKRHVYTGFYRGQQVNSLPVIAPFVTKTGNYTVTHNDRVVLGNAAASPITITLPSAATFLGLVYTIKRVNSTAGTVVVATTSAQTIDGAATKTLGTQYAFITVVSDNANWQIIGQAGTVT